MTPRTDDQVTALLRETFTLHEADLDLSRAGAGWEQRSLPTPGPYRRQDRRVLAVLGTAAAVAAVVGLATVLPTHSGRQAPGTTQAASNTPADPSGDPLAAILASRANAGAAALADFPALPGSTARSEAPSPVLAGVKVAYRPDQDATLTRFWTADGTVDGTVAQLTARPAPGFAATGRAEDPATGSVTQSFLYTPPVTQYGGPITIRYTVVALDAGVGVRADVVAATMGRRHPSNAIDPALVTGGTISLLFDDTASGTVVDRSGELPQADTVRIVEALDSEPDTLLGAEPSAGVVPGRCNVVPSTRLTVHTTYGDVAVTIEDRCRPVLTVERPLTKGADRVMSRPAPDPLEPSRQMTDLLAAAAGSVPLATSTRTAAPR